MLDGVAIGSREEISTLNDDSVLSIGVCQITGRHHRPTPWLLPRGTQIGPTGRKNEKREPGANQDSLLVLRWRPSSCSLWGTPGIAFPPGVGCRRRELIPHRSRDRSLPSFHGLSFFLRLGNFLWWPGTLFSRPTKYSNRTAGRKGEKMKTSTIGIFSAGILMVVASVGFGIAHAVGTKTDHPVLSLEDLWRSPKSSGKITGR